VRAAIAAAGTGGHVYPALAVAEALIGRGTAPDDIVFFGGSRMEASAVPAAGFEFVPFRLARLRRAVSAENLAIPWVLRSTSRAMADELRRREIEVVLGMSGYVTVPAAIAARRAGARLVVQEQNAEPGLAARFAARRAEVTLLGLPGPAERLPRSRVVGNPLRKELAAFDRSRLRPKARRAYGLPEDGFVLGVLGGSLGAQVLNESVSEIIAGWGPGRGVLHLTGAAAHQTVSRQAEGAPLPWRCRPFEDHMELFYAASDLVVCRAGAMTVSELAATGSAAVFVPLEAVGQAANAAALADVGGAVVVPQAERERLPAVVSALAEDDAERAALQAAARRAGRPGAAGAVADAVAGGHDD
jgi:UDP-N-acetylglucosamine--N-acetylmuramyl-(pentapeptide) pyrophosphoryl-undecaprenol N-acetylglucosamine transferase